MRRRFAIRYSTNIIGVLAVCVLWCMPTFAATRTWTGNIDSNWISSLNWGGSVPTSQDTAVIPGGRPNYPIIATSVTARTLIINSTGSGARVTVNSGGTLSLNDIEVNENGTLVLSGGTIRSNGELSVDGTVTLSSGTMNAGEVTVNASGTLTVSGGTLLNDGRFTDDGTVFISSGTILMEDSLEKRPSENLEINTGGTFNQSGGVVSVNDFITDNRDPPGTYNQIGGTLRIYRDFRHDGIFNGLGGTIEFNGDANRLTLASTPVLTQFFNVVLNGDPGLDNRAINIGVGGNWTTNVGIDLSRRDTTVIFNGSGAQTLGGPSTTTFANVIVNKPGTTLTLAHDEEINNGNLTVTSGTLDLSTFTMDRVSNGGTLTVADGAFLKIGGPDAFPVRYLNHLLRPTSTVEYRGTTQTVAAELYGHLVLSGSGSKTLPPLLLTRGDFTMSGTASANLPGLMTIDGNFTLNANTTFRASSLPHTIKGNFTNSGTFTAGTSTTILNGTSVQTIGGSNSTTFNSLTINNSSGVVLTGVDATVNNTLTFTSGTITTGANKVIIPFGGSVSRTSGHVVGNLQKYFYSGGRSATFEVGGAVAYTPINVSFASVSVAGNLIASTTTGDHPNIGSSNINPALTANRHWTLTNSGIVFTNYNATFNFVAADLDAGANPANFIVGRFSSGWTYPTVGIKNSTSTQALSLTGFGGFQLGRGGGPPNIGLLKSVSPTGTQPPGADLTYSVAFTNSGASPALVVTVTDAIPAHTDFKVGSETHSLGTTGLTVTVTYSNNGGTTYLYAPVSGGGGAPAGYDRNVTNILWTFTGSLSQSSPNNTGSLSFTTRIR